MTDKEIIVDGVNVAGCVRLQDDEISCDLGGECEGWENCYYKQLKRKEQECEELKEQLQANQPTGICETCMATAILQNDKYRKVLKRIEFEATKELENLEPDTDVYGCLFEILNIINK